jgi:hypothetical protein
MLSLDDPRWNELQHAYGVASDIPALLSQLSELPPTAGDTMTDSCKVPSRPLR